MNDEPLDKPVREILQDLRAHSASPPTLRGVANPQIIERVTFIAVVVSVVLSAGILLAMIWEGVAVLVGLKLIGSVWVLLTALLIFRAVNTQFSD